MSKLKTFLYNCTIILPVLKKIIAGIKFIVEFNKTNQEVISARQEILEQVIYLKEVVSEINNFHNINSDEEE